jgi:hypothetical protein
MLIVGMFLHFGLNKLNKDGPRVLRFIRTQKRPSKGAKDYLNGTPE